MEMRRKDRMLNEDQTLDILNRSEYGILSTIGVDNVPYGVPMNFVYEDEMCIRDSLYTVQRRRFTKTYKPLNP